MLNRKIYQLSREGKDVWIYLRDQGRWLERARILDVEGDLVLIRYETEDEDEICAWEEMIRLDSIGAVAQRLSSIPKSSGLSELPTTEDCPESEHLESPHLESPHLEPPFDAGEEEISGSEASQVRSKPSENNPD